MVSNTIDLREILYRDLLLIRHKFIRHYGLEVLMFPEGVLEHNIGFPGFNEVEGILGEKCSIYTVDRNKVSGTYYCSLRDMRDFGVFGGDIAEVTRVILPDDRSSICVVDGSDYTLLAAKGERIRQVLGDPLEVREEMRRYVYRMIAEDHDLIGNPYLALFGWFEALAGTSVSEG